ncbi:MAG: LysE family translocator [Candidatus Omnitrophica bacterium]|nr:LysE family translocator [Candidatus Omnitrophota bacterium]
MEIFFLLKGIIIGFLIAAPIGPVGILCMNRTLSEGRLSGFISGLGVATADAFYCAIAVYGVNIISDTIISQQFWFRIVGGTFLIYLGVKTFFSKPHKISRLKRSEKLIANYTSALFITLTNPVVILVFIVIFAGIGLSGPGKEHLSLAMMVAGVFLGSAACWAILSNLIGVLKDRFQDSTLKLIRRVSGSVISAFGVIVLLNIFSRL